MKIVRAGLYLVLIAYTLFALFRAIAIDIVDKLEHLAFSDLVLATYPPLACVMVYVIARTSSKRKAALGGVTPLLIMIVTAVTIIVAWFLYDDSNKSPMAVLAAGFLASCGWIYTSREARHNARKSHTLNILLQMRNSAEFNKHRDILIDRLQKYDVVTNKIIAREQELINQDEVLSRREINLSRSARYIANYFEFLAAGFMLGDLDQDLFIHTHRSIMMTYYQWFYDYFEEERTDEKQNYNPRIFKNLANVNKLLEESLVREKRWGTSI